MTLSDRYARFHAVLGGSEAVYCPSVFDPISARIAEDIGFPIGILGGSVASHLVTGAPDVNVLTLSEFAEQCRRICRASRLPVIADADHGYGNALSVMRSVQELEAAGVASITIEDTAIPKNFRGVGPALIGIDEASAKIRAAVAARGSEALAVIARTNAVGQTSDQLLARANAFLASGADGICLTGVTDVGLVGAVHAATALPIFLITYSGGNFGDLHALAVAGVRVWLDGHTAYLASVQAIYTSLTKLREGIYDRTHYDLAPADLMAQVTRGEKSLLSGQVETISQKSLIFCGFPGKIGWCRFQLILALFGGFPRGWPMNTGKTIFAQLMDFLPWSNFARIVGRYGGDQRVRTLSCAEQYRAMAFAQLTYRESLRDIETCLSVQASKLYFMGFREPVRRSTLADANETRDWRIYAELAQRLIVQARKLYVNEDLGLDLSNTVYALDSTTIDLCLSVFPWAHFRTTKAAVKMHTLLDLRGSIPSFIHVSDGKLHDVHALDLLLPEAGAIYVMDRGYVDFARLYTLHQAGAFFVTRAKSNMDARRVYSDLVDRTSGIICDQSIALNGFYAGQNYPEKLRRIRFKDADSGKTLVFLSNNFALPALTIADLYRNRWQVELFFKWIKQHLRIKQFFGTSENAVKTQIWIAVSVYVLVAIVKKRLGLEASLYTLLQIFSVTLFEKIPIEQALSLGENRYDHEAADNQLNLFAS